MESINDTANTKDQKAPEYTNLKKTETDFNYGF